MVLEFLLENEVSRLVLIVVGALVLAKLVELFLQSFVKRAVARLKNETDNLIVSILVKPLYFFFIFAGIVFALRSSPTLGSVHGLLDKVLVSGTVLIAAYLVSQMVSLLITRWLKVHKKLQKPPEIINEIVMVCIYLVAAISVLAYYNVEITPLIATLGLGGLAVGLALQNTLSNLFAGIHIISDQPIKVGDFIELQGDITGNVEDIGWRSTRIRTLLNKIVIIPNAKLAESIIINHSPHGQGISIKVTGGVAFGSDLSKVERVALETAQKIQRTVPGATREYKPGMSFTEFGDSNILFGVILGV
ncbi:MAG: mechanosensitive ion channel, partial [Candidatus Diapherotrites archaeon]|nr:mechanosensitive ion channel [Candidatus Diapherotrites archaeon]